MQAFAIWAVDQMQPVASAGVDGMDSPGAPEMTSTTPIPDRKPYISPPPSKGDVDQVSQDQALIADEWAPEPDVAKEKAAPEGAA